MSKSFKEILNEMATPATRPADQQLDDQPIVGTQIQDPNQAETQPAIGFGIDPNTQEPVQPVANVTPQVDPAPATVSVDPAMQEPVQPVANVTPQVDPQPAQVGIVNPQEPVMPSPTVADDQPMDQDEQEEPKKPVNESFAAMFAEKLNEGTEFEISMQESLAGLFESQGLTEEFSNQAVELFEAAVNDVAQQHLQKINAYAGYVFESMMEEKLQESEQSIDGFMKTVIAEWVEENQLAIETGARVAIAESFMGNLQNILAEHFMEVPASKGDLYESLLEKQQEDGEQIQESVQENQELLEENKQLKKQLCVESFTKGMTALQAARIRDLADGLVFESDEQFKSKLTILKESYVEKQPSKKVESLVEDVEPLVEDKPDAKPAIDPMVGRYANALNRFATK
jgi:regulator of replication initiation timing